MCAICGHRPAKGKRFCAVCQSKVDKEERNREARQPVKFATYQGHVIGFYKDASNKGTLVPRLLKRKPDGLPKRKTINLNEYCPGFSREQVKKLKHAILALANS